MSLSLAQQVANSGTHDAFLASLSRDELKALEYEWSFWGRPEQQEPEGPWTKWFSIGGRGAGKTRTATEWVCKKARDYPGCRIHLVAQTAGDARDTMIEGESGILAVSPPDFMPEYEPSKRRLTWPNGSIALLFTAEKPRALRGPQCHFAWADEAATWAMNGAAWDMLLFGLRLPARPEWTREYSPKVLVSTTPKPVRIIRDHVRQEKGVLVPNANGVVVTHMPTYDNIANLAPEFVEQVVGAYEGTTAGQEELHAMLLEQAEGALWTRESIARNRVRPSDVPDLKRKSVGVDPPGGATECGIVGGGLDYDGTIYILADVSKQERPAKWGRRAVDLYLTLGASRLVGEQNYGGDMVEHTVRTVPRGADVNYRKVHASRGKQARAEPVASLQEQNRVKWVGEFPELEDECCNWEPDTGMPSPNRLDAMVWMAYDLAPPRSRIRLDAIPGMPKGEAA